MGTIDWRSSIGFIGAGMVGTSLAVALSRKGYSVGGVYSRSSASARTLGIRVTGCKIYLSAQELADACQVVFVTTPDDAIREVCSRVTWQKDKVVVHCSGALSLDVLDNPAKAKALVGSFHPLQTFSSLEGALRRLPGSTFAIEGNEPVRSFLERMSLDLGGKPVFLKPGDKTLYHASAVMASGFAVTLMQQAADLWSKLGYSGEDAIVSLLPLLNGTSDAMGIMGIPEALTGPIARGDVGTVGKHLEALSKLSPEAVSVYCSLSLAQIPIAIEKGTLKNDAAAKIRYMLKEQLKLSWTKIVSEKP